MTEQPNEFAQRAAKLLGDSPQYASDKEMAGAHAELRRELVDDLGPARAVAGFLDEIAVRLAPPILTERDGGLLFPDDLKAGRQKTLIGL